MKNLSVMLSSYLAAAVGLTQTPLVMANVVTDALSNGQAYGDLRFRYESVEQDNTKKDASALTVRTRLGYKTDSLSGFSGVVEFEDSRTLFGADNYNNTLGKDGDYSTIADPETTELDQGYIQYKKDTLTAKLGRQVLTYDNHRFIGHVGWRQDRQTFDGLSLNASPIENLTLSYAYLDERNRIFAEGKDVDSKDHLLNASYKMPFGKLTAYGYLLEIDQSADNALDTFGVRFAGAHKLNDLKLLYAAEYASQESEGETTDFDVDYYFLEGGVVISGITAKLGYEVLGSDDGDYGFSTPLATLHKFNGWTDQFLSTGNLGLVDVSFTLGAKIPKGKVALIYHDFEADEDSATVEDLGSEIDFVLAHKVSKKCSVGVKYAAYSAGDDDANKVDTDKAWVWLSTKF